MGWPFGSANRAGQILRVRHEPVRSLGNRYRPLGILSDGETGNSERCRFLLQTAGICDDGERPVHEIEHLDVANRRKHANVAERYPGRVEPLCRPRMNRENHGSMRGDFAKRARDSGETAGLVHVGWPVERHDDRVAADAERIAEARLARFLQAVTERVDHDVSDEGNLVVRLSLALEVFDRVARRGEQQICQPIRDQAVDLLRHRSVVAAQPRLDVGNPDRKLRRDQRGGGRRVDVAVDHDPVGCLLDQNRLEPLHDSRRLHSMRQRADLEIDLRFAKAEIPEKGRRQRVIVVLACVHHGLFETGRDPRPEDRRHLGEVWASANDVQKLHA